MFHIHYSLFPNFILVLFCMSRNHLLSLLFATQRVPQPLHPILCFASHFCNKFKFRVWNWLSEIRDFCEVRVCSSNLSRVQVKLQWRWVNEQAFCFPFSVTSFNGRSEPSTSHISFPLSLWLQIAPVNNVVSLLLHSLLGLLQINVHSSMTYRAPHWLESIASVLTFKAPSSDTRSSLFQPPHEPTKGAKRFPYPVTPYPSLS